MLLVFLAVISVGFLSLALNTKVVIDRAKRGHDQSRGGTVTLTPLVPRSCEHTCPFVTPHRRGLTRVRCLLQRGLQCLGLAPAGADGLFPELQDQRALWGWFSHHPVGSRERGGGGHRVPAEPAGSHHLVRRQRSQLSPHGGR